MHTQFFIPMKPPTTTHNAKQIHAYMKGGKPCAVLHDSPELKAVRLKAPFLSCIVCPRKTNRRRASGSPDGQVVFSR